MRVRHRDIRNRCVDDMRACVCRLEDCKTSSPPAFPEMAMRSVTGRMRDYDFRNTAQRKV